MPGKVTILQRTVLHRPLFLAPRAGVALGAIAILCAVAALAISAVKTASLVDFFSWLGDTDWSSGLHGSQYAYSIIESLHVWTLALFFGTVVMFDLRLLGLSMRNVPVSQVVDRLLPWTMVAFVMMVITAVVPLAMIMTIRPDAADMVMMPGLRRPEFTSVADDLRAVLAELAVHHGIADADLLDSLGEGVEHERMIA